MDIDRWYWAVGKGSAAGDRFVIAKGQRELWLRVKYEFGSPDNVAWMAVNARSNNDPVELRDFLDMALRIVSMYGVNHNRFVFEAAQIPVFALFLRRAPFGLHDYVSNPAYSGPLKPAERYSDDKFRELEAAVASTVDFV